MDTSTDAAPPGALQHIVGTQCRQTTFQPLQFFVSWNGVLCVVYKGFPPSIASLKRLLPLACHLPQENPGSRWPKTSIAALNDGVALTENDLRLLVSICKTASCKLHLCPAVAVKQLSYIHYLCRFGASPPSCASPIDCNIVPFMRNASSRLYPVGQLTG